MNGKQYSQLAQIVEHLFEAHGVGGASPSLGTKLRNIMQDWQNRVIEEHQILEEKCRLLYIFLAGKLFEDLGKEDQELLKTQYYAMMVYYSILTQRINKF